jgi:glycosyltransferase involved in cell wall biosynthesis
VLCTLQGEELFLSGLEPAYRDRALTLIRSHVQHVDRFVAVSEFCAEYMSTLLQIPRGRVSVVPLGIRFNGYEPRVERPAGGAFRVGFFARIAPEKGLVLLAEAYVRLRKQMGGAPATLKVAGYMASNHQAYLETAHSVLSQAGFGAEFSYEGSLDRPGKLAFLRGLDVLSVPATYDEPKGMFLLEAMAAGVPVVQPRRGAFTEVLEKTGGGLLVPPDDPEALADGLHHVWTDQRLAARLGQQAFHGVRAHYSVATSAQQLVDVYQSTISQFGGAASC